MKMYRTILCKSNVCHQSHFLTLFHLQLLVARLFRPVACVSSEEESAFQQRAQLTAGQPSRQHCPATGVQTGDKLLPYILSDSSCLGNQGPPIKA